MFAVSLDRLKSFAVPAVAVVFALFWWVCLPAAAQDARPLRGVALIVGNETYAHLGKLANPADDARAIELLLDSLGFETTTLPDRNARQLSRALDNFIEDAEGADVAVVYYAGHGIEAGGENFLVPVDADLSALDAAAERLVPVSAFVERLRAAVPLAIVLLDACRDNPFPAGSLVRLAPDAAALPMGEGGLSETRGATRLAPPSAAQVENFGTVLGFAAEPGKVALDGAPGENSPYAAALLRHLDTMAGEEFGMVMRMVGEEVYLKTGGRQRPWVNENLHRRLYLGKTPTPPDGDEGDILAERRRLLVTIAALPDIDRRRVEAAATASNVPMDVAHAILTALGQDIPDQPADLESLLRTQAADLSDLLAGSSATRRSDPEIERLSELSRQAVSEGALETAQKLRIRITARAVEVDRLLSDLETDIGARRLELAATHVESARVSNLVLDHRAAADYFSMAYEQAAGRNEELALDYRIGRINALLRYGVLHGDDQAVSETVSDGLETLKALQAGADVEKIARVQNNLGAALLSMGRPQEALQLYRAVLQRVSREDHLSAWGNLQQGLGAALHILGEAERSLAKLYQAQEGFRAASLAYLEADLKAEWAMVQTIIAQTLQTIGNLEGGGERFDEALETAQSTLQELDRNEMPLEWISAWNTIGNAHIRKGHWSDSDDEFAEAATAFMTGLEGLDRDRMPMLWPTFQTGLGDALLELGIRRGSPSVLRRSVAAYRAAIDAWELETKPREWVRAQTALAKALIQLGFVSDDRTAIAQAIDVVRAAWEADVRYNASDADENLYRNYLETAERMLRDSE